MSETTEIATDKPLYLIGTSGHPHYGDEFITAGWLRFLARTRPDAEVWLDCPKPGLAAHLFGGLHPRLHFTDTLFRLVWETTDMAPAAADEHIDRVMTRLGSPLYDIGLLNARRAGSVHVLGGAYLNDHWPHHVGLLRAALRLRDVAGARLAATGLSLIPTTDPDRVREALGAFDHATVRDTESADLSGVEQSCDDACLDLRAVAGVRDVQHVADGTGDVWVCLQSDLVEPHMFDAAVDAVRQALTSPDLAGRTVHYLEALPGADRVAFDRLSDLIPEEHFMPFVKLWEEGFPARAGQTWLTSRFHMHLLAAASGAQGSALEVSDDSHRAQHESLVEAGTGWSVTPAGATTITPPTWDRAFRRSATDLRQVKLDEAQKLYPPLPSPPRETATTAPAPPPRPAGLFRRR